MAFELFLIYTFSVAVSSYSAVIIFVFILSVVVSCLYVCIVLGHGMMSQPSMQRLSLYLHTSDNNKPMPFLGIGRYIKWWIFWDEEFDLHRMAGKAFSGQPMASHSERLLTAYVFAITNLKKILTK